MATPVHFFVFTLGFSGRAVAYAYRNERHDTLLNGHERVLRHVHWFASLEDAQSKIDAFRWDYDEHRLHRISRGSAQMNTPGER